MTPVRSRFLTNASLARLGIAVVCASLLVSAGAVVIWTVLGARGGLGVIAAADAAVPAAAPAAAPAGQGSATPMRYVPIAATPPVALRVPKLGINAPVLPISLSSDAVLEPPSDPQEVGWWTDSAQPGSDSGQTVITGHTVHTGGGALDQLDTLVKGDRVDVVTDAGALRYRVEGTAVLSKADVATYAQNLFGQDRGEGRLILITCDDWNGSYYESNAVSLAIPIGQPVREPDASARRLRYQTQS